ncbi:hypothetical protein ACIBSV_46675 [Embleya sp. NPDC050154]|uniref:hypothetical protein n=1 Tax=Embleya sp. NPDC050154 TaxID=3363988 RepID=UPI0037B6B8C0
MGPDAWAQIVVGVVVAAVSVVTARSARSANRETALVTTTPAERAEDRETYKAHMAEMRLDVDAAKAQAEAAQRRVEEIEGTRRQDSLTINALVRYIRKMARAFREHDIPPPDPDPADALVLQAHGLP